MNILQVNTADLGGGAERAARSLCVKLAERGHGSWLAVGRRKTGDPGVLELPPMQGERPWSGRCRKAREWIDREGRGIPGAWRLARGLSRLADGGREIRQEEGLEEFDYPGSRSIARLPPVRPDLIHFHNLHGDYFDLSCLPQVTAQYPCVLTAHDEWTYTGHCVFSLDCNRWMTGCGQCPHLSIYVPLKKDGTALNWRRKRAIYRKSELFAVSPSQWLGERIGRSMLLPLGLKVIPNGIDLEVFKPHGKRQAREAIGVEPESAVGVFAAAGGQGNPFKDFETVAKAVDLCAARSLGRPLVFLVLGAAVARETIKGGSRIREIPFQRDPASLAQYYCAADFCLVASKGDNLPFVAMEALACGTPVIATAVGGIPEEVDGLRGWWASGAHGGTPEWIIAAECDPASLGTLNRHDIDEATGILVPKGDAQAMASAVTWLLAYPETGRQLGLNAVRAARSRYDLDRMVADYEQLYAEAIDDWGRRHPRRRRVGPV